MINKTYKTLIGSIFMGLLHFTNTANFHINNYKDALDSAVLDPLVNIKIAPLAGDERMTMYVTLLKPGVKVTAHLHEKDVELYHILKGTGEIYTGKLNEHKKVEWNEPTPVKQGDVFSINPHTVHQLKNSSEIDDLILLFVCPHSHLKEDRIVTSDF